MEIRQAALRILESPDLETKLTPLPEGLADGSPGPALRPKGPARSAELCIVPGKKAPVPSVEGMHDPKQRVRILHALANHELQAVELFAWALVAFPEAPADFRSGLCRILDDEQRHTRMYIARVEAHGARLGDFPVSGYFWNKTPDIGSPLEFVCAMSLTFENANLDHTVELEEAARRAGDAKTARVIARVHRDEIEHVRFGWRWLQHWKGERTPWQAYRESLTWPLRPARARGARFHRGGREAAGLTEDFIHRLESGETD